MSEVELGGLELLNNSECSFCSAKVGNSKELVLRCDVCFSAVHNSCRGLRRRCNVYGCNGMYVIVRTSSLTLKDYVKDCGRDDLIPIDPVRMGFLERSRGLLSELRSMKQDFGTSNQPQENPGNLPTEAIPTVPALSKEAEYFNASLFYFGGLLDNRDKPNSTLDSEAKVLDFFEKRRLKPSAEDVYRKAISSMNKYRTELEPFARKCARDRLPFCPNHVVLSYLYLAMCTLAVACTLFFFSGYNEMSAATFVFLLPTVALTLLVSGEDKNLFAREALVYNVLRDPLKYIQTKDVVKLVRGRNRLLNSYVKMLEEHRIEREPHENKRFKRK